MYIKYDNKSELYKINKWEIHKMIYQIDFIISNIIIQFKKKNLERIY